MHVKEIVKLKKLLICAQCSKPAYTACRKYNDDKDKRVELHCNTKAGDNKGYYCFYYYYNNTCFGLGKNNASSIFNSKKGDQKLPSDNNFKKNTSHIESLTSLSRVQFQLPIACKVPYYFLIPSEYLQQKNGGNTSGICTPCKK